MSVHDIRAHYLSFPFSPTFSADYGVPQPLFDGFTGTMKLSDFPQPFIAVVLLRFMARTSRCYLTRPVRGSSRFSHIECSRMHRVSDFAGPVFDSLRNAVHRVAFPTRSRSRHPGRVISELNGWPALPLSTLHVQAHGHPRMTRGHDGAASPFMWGSFIPYSMPVYPGAFGQTR
jgi:hypothetical protein